MKKTTRHTTSAVAGVLLVTGTLAACGGGDDAGAEVASLGSTATSTANAAVDGDAGEDETDPEEAMLEYTQCMRDHGIDMPDPATDGNGRGMIALDVDPEDEDFQEAQEACEPIMENAFADIEIDPQEVAERQEQLLEYAQCMREHGVDMPDPVFGDNGEVRVEAGPGQRMPDDEDFEAANEECAPDGMFMTAERVEGED